MMLLSFIFYYISPLFINCKISLDPLHDWLGIFYEMFCLLLFELQVLLLYECIMHSFMCITIVIIISTVFNVGEYRRKVTNKAGTVLDHTFFDPDNAEAQAIRE